MASNISSIRENRKGNSMKGINIKVTFEVKHESKYEAPNLLKIGATIFSFLRGLWHQKM
jgi:hypothetical protein